jgi:uncharacterized protein
MRWKPPERIDAKSKTVDTEMNERFANLFAYEKTALLEALRRDLRAELTKAASDSFHTDWHLANYRTALKLLEALNPRSERLRKFDTTDPQSCQMPVATSVMRICDPFLEE